MEGAAGVVDAASVELDEEEDVQPGQPDGVDGEEVSGEHLVGVIVDRASRHHASPLRRSSGPTWTASGAGNRQPR
jgi:hypothetical protein